MSNENNYFFLRLEALPAEDDKLPIAITESADGTSWSQPRVGELPASLVRQCADLQGDPITNAGLATPIGEALGKLLTDGARRLRHRVQQPLHLVLQFRGDPTLRGLNFELLRYVEAATDRFGNQVVHEPVLTARWALVRTLDDQDRRTAREGRGGRVRVLLLVGSQIQPPTVPPADYEARDAVDHIVAALGQPDTPFDVQIAAAEGMLGVLRQNAKALCTPGDVADALRSEGGYDVVFFIGHSDAAPRDARKAGATALCFDFVDAEGITKQEPIPIHEIRDALTGTPTRLVVFQCCLSREHLAEALLPVVDDVVGMQAMLPVILCKTWCRAFFGALRDNRTVAEAVRQTRAALDREEHTRAFPWVPAHWSQVHPPVPFRDESRRLLRDYCDRLVRQHQNLHGRLLPASAPHDVEHIPVEVHVAHRHSEDESQLHGKDARLRGQPLTLASLVDEKPCRFAALGKPGSGKTTSARDLTRRLAKARNPERVPVFVRLRQLTEADSATPQGLLQHACTLLYGDSLPPGLLAQLTQLGKNGHLVLILDGLDEVSDRHRSDVTRMLGQLDADWSLCPMLVTSRPFGFVLPHATFREAELLPLGERQQRDLLQQWLTLERCRDIPDVIDATMLHVQKSPALLELAATPLFLVLIGKQIAGGKQVAALATRRHTFFADVIDDLLQGRHNLDAGTSKPLDPISTAREIHGYIAWRWVRSFTIEMPQWRLVERLKEAPQSADWLRAGKWADWGEFLHQAVDRTLLLRCAGKDAHSEHAAWDFLHRSLMEALCAQHLVRNTKDAAARVALLDELEADIRQETARQEQQGDERVEANTTDAARSLAEALALMTGSLGREADSWVAQLLARPALRKVGIESVALAESLSQATLGLALAACEDLGERRIVYDVMAERGEGEAVASLEARALAIPRQWEELYYIDECLQCIGKRRPSLGEQVARATEALFAGCPPTTNQQIVDAFSFVPGKPREPLWRSVPGGTFLMGSPATEKGRFEAERQFPAEVSPFAISATTITIKQFRLFDAEHTHGWPESVRANMPVTEVRWFAATMFARWLSRRHSESPMPGVAAGCVVRLPREVEWEYAARAGTTTPFWCGESLSHEVGAFGQPNSRPSPSGARRPNALGLYDVHGNVWEWCADWFGDYPMANGGAPIRNWPGPRSGRFRVQRGGCYWSVADSCRSAFRFRNQPDRSNGGNGFRLVVSAPELDH